jgi:hypothetical protein
MYTNVHIQIYIDLYSYFDLLVNISSTENFGQELLEMIVS